MEFRKDVIGEKHYASRNFDHLRHVCGTAGASRTQVDWCLTLRQNRKPIAMKGTASAPNLQTQDLSEAQRETRQREPPAALVHPEGEYHTDTRSTGRYQNMGNTANLIQKNGNAHTLNWHLNLRGSLHATEHKELGWKRHYARSHQSFDMMKENCTSPSYQMSHITPQDRRSDPSSSALPIATIRDDPISFRRWPGCEGTQAGQWGHLIADKRYGHKSRRQVQYEVTLRENSSDPNGARIQDNRSDGCIVEMMGKKSWKDATHHEPLARKGPHGDPKTYHMRNLRTLPEGNEENRSLRRQKHPRSDADIPETHVSKAKTQIASP